MSVQGEWEVLQSKFCSTFFLISRVIHLRREVLRFKQKDKESLAAWAHLIDLSSSGPELAIPDPMLLQHFYQGLSEKSTHFLDIASVGVFLHLSISEGRAPMAIMTPLKKRTIQSPHKKMFRQPNPCQFTSKALAADPISEPFLGTPKEEEIHPLELVF